MGGTLHYINNYFLYVRPDNKCGSQNSWLYEITNKSTIYEKRAI